MITASQINELLLRLDIAAIALTDPQHPDVTVALRETAHEAEAAGLVDCTVAEAQETAAGLAVKLAPAHRHCAKCGAVFEVTPQTHATECGPCAAAAAAGTPTG